MITRDQIIEASAHVGLATVPPREFRFYRADFVPTSTLSCLTIAAFDRTASDDFARSWSAACFCHSENLCESWPEFFSGLEGDLATKQISVAEFYARASELIESVNPGLTISIAGVRDLLSDVQRASAVSSGAAVKSIIAVASKAVVVLIWEDTQNA